MAAPGRTWLVGTAALLVCLGLGVPPASGEDAAFVTQPVSVHGYTMRVVVDHQQSHFGGVSDYASVTLFQRRGRSVQSFQWSSPATRRFRLFRVSHHGRRADLRVNFGGAARL